MSNIVVILHVIVCIGLILVVLLQSDKGTDMGSAFGMSAGSNTLFGNTGASTFLSKATTIAAVIFMITSLSLAYMSDHKKSKSIISDIKPAKNIEQVEKSDMSKDKALNTAETKK